MYSTNILNLIKKKKYIYVYANKFFFFIISSDSNKSYNSKKPIWWLHLTRKKEIKSLVAFACAYIIFLLTGPAHIHCLSY